jgi:hypothetical protein
MQEGNVVPINVHQRKFLEVFKFHTGGNVNHNGFEVRGTPHFEVGSHEIITGPKKKVQVGTKIALLTSPTINQMIESLSFLDSKTSSRRET